MIEDHDVILDCSQETGYRLCYSDDVNSGVESIGTFSAIWDSNQDRLFVCRIDGLLTVVDQANDTTKHYRLKFRQFTTFLPTHPPRTQPFSSTALSLPPADATLPGKANYLHWDRIVLIPGRPDEIMFLHGVSRSIYYTCLPGIAEGGGFMSSITRSDFSDFIYGTPVVELLSHSFRIASVAVNQTGNVLASGDEQGNIGLLLMRLLDTFHIKEINKLKPENFGASTSRSVPVFTRVLPEYKLQFQAHKGPVFCLQWLPIAGESAEDSYDYALASGSADKVIRIWRVTCSSISGVSVAPLFELNFMPSSILSMSAHLTATASSSSAATHGATIFFGAGTDQGIVLVWSFQYSHLLERLTNRSGQICIDDGSNLHSMLQAGDKPIPHVAISQQSSSDRCVLVATDVAGAVRIFCESDASNICANDSNNIISSEYFDFSSSNPRFEAVQNSLMRAFRSHFGPFVLCGETIFSLPTSECGDETEPKVIDICVGCSFSPNQQFSFDRLFSTHAAKHVVTRTATLDSVEGMLEEANRVVGNASTDSSFTAAVAVTPSKLQSSETRLMLCTKSGHIALYAVSALAGLYATTIEQSYVPKSPRPSPLRDACSPTKRYSDDSLDSFFDSLNMNSRKKAMSIDAFDDDSEPRQLPARIIANLSQDDESEPRALPSQVANVVSNRSASSRSSPNRNANTTSSANGQTASNVLTRNSIDADAFPRPPPVAAIIKEEDRRDRFGTYSSSNSNARDKRSASSVIESPGKDENVNVPRENAPKASAFSQNQPQPEVAVKSSPVISSRVTSAAPSSSNSKGSSAQASTSPILPPSPPSPLILNQERARSVSSTSHLNHRKGGRDHRDTSTAATSRRELNSRNLGSQLDDANATAALDAAELLDLSRGSDASLSNSNMRPPHTQSTNRSPQKQHSRKENIANANTSSNLQPSYLASDSKLAVAGIHTTEVLHQKLLAAQARLADEESVVTMETTSTDRYIASKIATGSSSVFHKYNGVTPLMVDSAYGSRTDPRLPSMARVKKAVDPKWVYKKEACGPTPEDLQSLRIQDPCPSLKLDFNRNRDPFPLESTINRASMQPEFNLKINFIDTFGDVYDDAFALWSYMEEDRSDCNLQSMLQLSSHR